MKRERERETDRQTDRQTERKTEIKTDRQRVRVKERERTARCLEKALFLDEAGLQNLRVNHIIFIVKVVLVAGND